MDQVEGELDRRLETPALPREVRDASGGSGTFARDSLEIWRILREYIQAPQRYSSRRYIADTC